MLYLSFRDDDLSSINDVNHIEHAYSELFEWGFDVAFSAIYQLDNFSDLTLPGYNYNKVLRNAQYKCIHENHALVDFIEGHDLIRVSAHGFSHKLHENGYESQVEEIDFNLIYDSFKSVFPKSFNEIYVPSHDIISYSNFIKCLETFKKIAIGCSNKRLYFDAIKTLKIPKKINEKYVLHTHRLSNDIIERINALAISQEDHKLVVVNHINNNTYENNQQLNSLVDTIRKNKDYITPGSLFT